MVGNYKRKEKRAWKMEMGSGSEAASIAPHGSSDSLNGLMFGKKIYFEDVAIGGNYSSSSSSSSTAMEAASSAPPPPPQKKGKGVAHERGGGGGGGGEGKGQQQQQQQPPPRCQVEGCKVDLTGAKTYYCRHKVCGMHSISPKVIVSGIEQRFCQQCSRFHQLHEFDQGKRSCRRRLAGHNERRRKPPPGPLSPRYRRLSSSLCGEDSGSRYRSFLMDFTCPRTSQQPSRDLWPIVRASDRVASVNQWQGDPSTQPCIHPSHHYTSEFQQSECYSGVSDSNCALSLLSNQAWGNTIVPRNRAPNLTTNVSGLDSTRMGEPMIVTSSCMVHPLVFKSHGAGGSTSNHEMGLGVHFHNDDGNGQFSSVLELGQGNGHCPDHGPVRAYDHSGHGMHWSL